MLLKAQGVVKLGLFSGKYPNNGRLLSTFYLFFCVFRPCACENQPLCHIILYCSSVAYDDESKGAFFKSKIRLLKPKESKTGFCVFLLNRSDQSKIFRIMVRQKKQIIHSRSGFRGFL